jgi:hypothetical protein
MLHEVLRLRDDIERLRKTYEQSIALKSIAEQLDYLIDAEQRGFKDLTKFARINIGVLAAPEVEDM